MHCAASFTGGVNGQEKLNKSLASEGLSFLEGPQMDLMSTQFF